MAEKKKTVAEFADACGEDRTRELEAALEEKDATIQALAQKCLMRAERIADLDQELQTLRNGG